MAWREHWTTLIKNIKIIHSAEESDSLLRELASFKKATVLAFVNSHAMNTVVKDKVFNEALCAADIILLDGSGMAILYRMMGLPSGLNMNGTDFIPKILSAFRGRTVAFWGTQTPYLDLAAKHCETKYENHVISTENGFHELEYYVELAIKLQPDLIILGMGMPKQERLAQAIRQSGNVNSLIVCGGAIIDFIGGRSPRAPKWMQSLGIEWIFRFALEPKRLYKRYIVGNPLFLYRTWVWKHGKLD